MTTFLTVYFILNSFIAGYFTATNTDDLDLLDSLFMFIIIMWFATFIIILYYCLKSLIFIFKSLKKLFYDQEI